MLTSDSFFDDVTKFKTEFKVNHELKQSLESQIGSVGDQVKDLQDVQRVLHFLAESINEFNETVTEKLATFALRDTFNDQSLSLEVNHSLVRGNPAVDIKLKDHNWGFSGDPLNSFGGGPGVLVGLVLRVLTVVRQNLARVLILDEPLMSVTSSYKELAARFVKKICAPVDQNGLGFSILIITQEDSLKKSADRSYYADFDSDGKSLTLIEE